MEIKYASIVDTVNHRLDEVAGNASTRVNNIVVEQSSSRRRKVRYFDCAQAVRRGKIRERLQKKLALLRKYNERKAAEEDAKNPGSRPSQTRAKPQKTSSQAKKMSHLSKCADRRQERKSSTRTENVTTEPAPASSGSGAEKRRHESGKKPQ